MLEAGGSRVHPALKELVSEASRALARLDADRLEELAASCEALNRELRPIEKEQWVKMAKQAKEAEGDMRVFSRVLQVTRANLSVINRLREMRTGRLEYGEERTQLLERAGSSHGDN
jgi:hypothetical protein